VAIVDQIRAVAKHRLVSKVETLSADELEELSQAISTILELKWQSGVRWLDTALVFLP
ncbi:MAG TPA: hypothetical protein EYG38_16860, partial [Verrucomicrobia bacterium]|nr:hypothetical protein [Verrucomicrobiota bacterium]